MFVITHKISIPTFILAIFSLLKIWNMNKFSGIIGLFNCQGSGKWPPTAGAQYIAAPESGTVIISGSLSPLDVDFLGEAADESWSGDCAIYLFRSGLKYPLFLI